MTYQMTYSSNIPKQLAKMPLKIGPSLYYNPKWLVQDTYYQNELLKWHSIMACQPHAKWVAKMTYPNDLLESHRKIWIIDMTCQTNIPKWLVKMTYQNDFPKWHTKMTCQSDIPRWLVKITYKNDLLNSHTRIIC